MREKISVCIPTYNEERNIKSCLASVYDWVDEIIIADGKSTDQTVQKAKVFGDKVKVYSYDNPLNFLLNKQRAIDHASQAWILQLDADEIVSPKLKQEILTVVNTKNQISKSKQINSQSAIRKTEIVAFWIPRLTYFLGTPLRKGGQYPDYCLRLYRKNIAKLPLKRIHDQVKINLVKAKELYHLAKPSVGYLQGNLEHYSYPSFSVYLRKWLQYGEYEGDKLFKQDVSISVGNSFKYFIWLPKLWFLKTYFRHKGLTDGFAGLVFSLFSALRYWLAYIKLYEKHQSQ